MRLPVKLLLAAAVATVACALALVLLLALLTVSGFTRLERESVEADLDRVARNLGREAEGLLATALDYATRDEADAFLRGGNPDFLERNLTGPVLDLAFVLLYDAEGSLVSGVYRDGAAPEGAPDPASILPSLGSLAPGGLSGIAKLSGRPYLLAFAPITSSNGASPPSGLLAAGRSLDAAFFARLSERLGANLAETAPEEALPASAGGRIVRVDRRAGRVYGYQSIAGMDGQEALLVRTEAERPIMDLAHRIGVILAAAAPVLLGLALGATYLAFRLILIVPLERLEAVLEAEPPASPGEAMDEGLARMSTRGDAIGRMASLLAETRRRIKASEELLTAANEHLEDEVAARTGELHRANHNLRLYRKIMEGTSEGVVVTDLAGSILEMNEAFSRIAGYGREELLGQNPRLLKSNRHESAFYAEMWASILGTGSWSGEVWDRRKNGEVYPKWLSVNTILNDEGKPENYVGLSADISRIKEAEERLNKLAFFDSLTGLPNRALFRDRLGQALRHAQRVGGRAALLFIDLDRFKDVNDSLGHLVGDELLTLVSRRIVAQVRESDTVCRLGGDEFTVVLSDLEKTEHAGEIARKIIRAVRESAFLGDSEVYVGASIGIAVYPFDGTDEESLIRKADAAMYEAKEAGKGQCRFASGMGGEASRKRIEIEVGLRRALARGDLLLHYQPQVATGAAARDSAAGLVGAEALLRWRREDGSITQPSEIIEVAEETGLILPIGDWVLGEACAEAALWARAGRPLVVSVNVSAIQFEQGNLAESVNAALERSGLEPRLLKLEVTESLFMRNLDKSIAAMRAVRNLGVAFAVDDFGTGFSSLKYLDRLPVDCLKIDKAFVDSLGDSEEGGEIVTAIVSLARAFGLSSVCEGVETDTQLAAIRRRGCDEVQGFLVSRPLGAEAFRAFALGKGR